MQTDFQPFDPRQEMRRGDFEVFHNRDRQLEAVGLHHHDFYEVYFFLSGRAEWRIEGKIYQLQPGDLLLSSPLELHQVTVQPGAGAYERIVLWLARPCLEGLGGGDEPLTRCFDRAAPGHTNRLRPADPSQVRALLDQLLAERQRTGYAGEMYARGCLLQLLALLNRLALEGERPAEEGSPIVDLAVEYIHRHYQQQLHLGDLAQRFHVSKYHLCHEFRRQVGTGVYQYLLLKRLQIAREMLLDGTPPGEAAAACGFKDYPNFYRAFKARYALSPSACLGAGQRPAPPAG